VSAACRLSAVHRCRQLDGEASQDAAAAGGGHAWQAVPGQWAGLERQLAGRQADAT
jgi:hypothetical protein